MTDRFRFTDGSLRFVALSCLFLVMPLAKGCTPPAPPPAPSDVVEVKIRNAAFVPHEVTIQVGQTVRWDNEDPLFHTITSGRPGDPDAGALFDSGDLIPFDSFEHTFTTPGTFLYFSKYDQNRPSMVDARIIVVE
mgnify:CR=1 FL=1